MPTLIQYRQPLPTTIILSGMAAILVWVVANYVTGADYLWFRVTYAVALTLLAPALLEPIAAAISNSPDDRNLRVLFGALHAYLFCLFMIVIFFGYIQYASPWTKMGLVILALGIGIYTIYKTPDVSDAVVKTYQPIKSTDIPLIFWLVTFHLLPVFFVINIRRILSVDFLTSLETSHADPIFYSLALTCLFTSHGIFREDTSHPGTKLDLGIGVYFRLNDLRMAFALIAMYSINLSTFG